MIEDYYDFPMGSDFWGVGQSPARTAMVDANWRGCDVGATGIADARSICRRCQGLHCALINDRIACGTADSSPAIRNSLNR